MDAITPGDWHVDGYDNTSVISKISEYHYKHICKCNYGYEKPDENIRLNQANARFIASSPEMFQLLNEGVKLGIKDDVIKWQAKVIQFIQSVLNNNP